MKREDAIALDLVEYGYMGDAVVVRCDGESIAVIATDTKRALELMQRAVAELTMPRDETLQ